MKIHTEPSNLVGRPVESMQIMLRVVAEGNDRLIPVVPDGIFGRNTMAAVTAFQRYYGLPATGVMNQVTWERLVEVYRHDLVLQSPAEGMQPILNPYQTLKPGESNYHVHLVQVVLRVLGSVYRGIPPVPINGTMDASTVTAVRRFQTLSAIPVTGEVDKHTWQLLSRQYTLAAGDGNGQERKKEMQ